MNNSTYNFSDYDGPASALKLLLSRPAGIGAMALRCVTLVSRRVFKNGHHCRPLARTLATQKAPKSLFSPLDTFADRHVGPDDKEVAYMLTQLGYDNMEAFVTDTVPPKIRVSASSVSNESIPSLTESELHRRARELGQENKPFKSYIGMGYHNAVVPR